jgi:lambda repressor-like predicted transcriptional regulator
LSPEANYARDVARRSESVRRATLARNEAIKAMREDGASLRAIAEAAQLSHTAIARILEK